MKKDFAWKEKSLGRIDILTLCMVCLIMLVLDACTSDTETPTTTLISDVQSSATVKGPELTIITQSVNSTVLATDTISTPKPSPIPTSTAEVLPYIQPGVIETELSKPPTERIQAGFRLIYTSLDPQPEVDQFLDLDSFSYSIDEGDIKFSGSSDGEVDFHLEFVNGALAVAISENNAGFDGCADMGTAFSSEKLVVRDEIGNYFCVITSESRLALIHLDKARLTDSVSRLRVSFVTWREGLPKGN
jgi:hypothetical protein